MFIFYSILLTIGFILMSPIFLLKREKYAAGFWQRMGFLPAFEPNGKPVVWLHCVSVGEAQAARPLVEQLRREFPDYNLIVSTTTKTGQTLAQDIFKNTAAAVFYFPFDWRFAVRRALANFKPDAVLLMETELWFNFIREAGKKGVFLAIVNGRLSEKSFKNYSYIKGFMRRTLARIDLALMQAAADAERLMNLGIAPAKVKVTGNIKFDQIHEQNDLTETLRDRFAISEAAPLIVAASTHAPEEKWILEAFALIRQKFPQNAPRLLLAPRHPERFAEVAELIGETGISFARRSAEISEKDTAAEIILLDSIGELRAAYPLAELVFVGGSLIPHGGQSVLEPAACGKPVVTGSYTMNFAAVTKEFLRQNALVQLPETNEKQIARQLADVFAELLKNAAKRADLGENALRVMEKNRGATARTIENLRPFLRFQTKK